MASSKLAIAHVADIGRQQEGAIDAGRIHQLRLQRESQNAGVARTAHVKLRVLLARDGQKLDELVEFQPRQLISVDGQNLVAGGEAGLGGGRSLHRLQHDHAAGKHADDAAEALALALLHLLQLLELAGIEENRVRIERLAACPESRPDKTPGRATTGSAASRSAMLNTSTSFFKSRASCSRGIVFGSAKALARKRRSARNGMDSTAVTRGLVVLGGVRSRARSSGRSAPDKGTPLASHIFGYMLMDVNPGMVLISLMKNFPVAASSRKSTRAIPSQSTA